MRLLLGDWRAITADRVPCPRAFQRRLTLMSGKYDFRHLALSRGIVPFVDYLLPRPANSGDDPLQFAIITDETITLWAVTACARPLGAHNHYSRTMRTSLCDELKFFSALGRNRPEISAALTIR